MSSVCWNTLLTLGQPQTSSGEICNLQVSRGYIPTNMNTIPRNTNTLQLTSELFFPACSWCRVILSTFGHGMSWGACLPVCEISLPNTVLWGWHASPNPLYYTKCSKVVCSKVVCSSYIQKLCPNRAGAKSTTYTLYADWIIFLPHHQVCHKRNLIFFGLQCQQRARPSTVHMYNTLGSLVCSGHSTLSRLQ